MPRLLIVSMYFPPSAASGSFRILGFARHLPSFNWNVSVVASGPIPWQSDDPELLKRVPANTTVRYAEFPLARIRRLFPLLLQRLRLQDGMSYWNDNAMKACREIVANEKPDVVLTSGPPHTVHQVGRALQRHYRIPWVADFRDPWCSWGNEPRYTGKPVRFSIYRERAIFKHADQVIANTPNTAEMFREAYPQSASRIVAIPNGYEPFEPETASVNGSDPQTMQIVHTGVVYGGRDPRPVAEAIRTINVQGLLGERSLRLKLLGQCLDANLQRDLHATGLAKYVEMHEHVPHRDAARAMQSADLLLLLDTPDRRIGVPAKLYEYVGARRPILALAQGDGDTARVLQKSRLPHSTISEWTSANLQKSILSLINESKPHVDSCTDDSCKEFTREARAGQLASVLDQLIS